MIHPPHPADLKGKRFHSPMDLLIKVTDANLTERCAVFNLGCPASQALISDLSALDSALFSVLWKATTVQVFELGGSQYLS